MRLRPYVKKDFAFVQRWIDDARTHALWCAGRVPYPLTEESFDTMLEQNQREYGSCGYTFTEDSGQPVGFFAYNINETDNSGFVCCIVVDSSLRGKGYGSQMLRLLLQYAYTITNVSRVRLNVFDVNERAKRCYEKSGFSEESFTADALEFENECWGRFSMVADKQSFQDRK